MFLIPRESVLAAWPAFAAITVCPFLFAPLSMWVELPSYKEQLLSDLQNLNGETHDA